MSLHFYYYFFGCGLSIFNLEKLCDKIPLGLMTTPDLLNLTNKLCLHFNLNKERNPNFQVLKIPSSFLKSRTKYRISFAKVTSVI